LVAVWDCLADKCADFAKRHQIATACRSVDELLAADVDGIYVCTPPDSHCPHALAAMEKNRHVLVEKPMACSTADCERMIRAAGECGVTLGVSYFRRAFPKMQKIKELIQQGVLGQPVWVNIVCHSWFCPAAGDPNAWRVLKARSGGGGSLTDIGVHRFDLLDYWLGESKVRYRNLHNLVNHYEVEDGSSIFLELANGAPVHAYFSWNSKTWMDRFEMVGSEGKIIAEPLDSPSLVVIRGRDREELKIDLPQNWHLPIVADFVRAVAEKRPPLCDGAGGLRTNRLLDEILRGTA
jgi:predicted dehydrogenase